MASSQHTQDARTQSQRQPPPLALGPASSQPVLDEPGHGQVAPYLTHVVTHHGQLTLIPPQNAGRIRKTRSKKKRQPSSRDRRLEDEEPRFTTAVPASSSRKLHPAPAHVRTRKHAISAPSPTTPTGGRRYDPVPDDQSIPDYPPPSFEDAIASPPVPPNLASIPSSQNPSTQPNASSNTHAASGHPYLTHAAAVSSATLLTGSSLCPDSAATSHVSLARSLDSHRASETQNQLPHLSSPSTTTLLSPTATQSTSLSEMSLLRPPRARPVQSSPLAQQNAHATPSSPVRLTSPSTTTLVSSATAVRDSPAKSQSSFAVQPSPSRRAPSPEQDEEPESPLVEPLSPLIPLASPHPRYRGSVSTVSDVVEELSLEPYQRWSADRRLGLSLEQRVQREFERRNTKEAKEAFGIAARSPEAQEAGPSGTPSSSIPSTPPSSPGPYARRCSHCGSVRPRECGDTQTIDEDSDEDEQDDEDDLHYNTSRHSSPLPRGVGQSPYLHPAAAGKAHSHTQSRARFHSHSPELGSPPSSPLSPSMSIFKMPSAWASSVTLSLANALGPHKVTSSSASTTPASSPSSGSGPNLPPGSGLKRKESFGVKRLFGSLKGKEREREREREREYAHLPAPSSSVSSSESSVESVDGWEVVGGDCSSLVSSSHSTAPTSPARSMPEASSPTSEYAHHGAFLTRSLRPRPTTLPLPGSPTTPTSPSPIVSPVSPVTQPVSATAARPYLPEKSPLRLIASANHLRQTHAQAQALNPPAASSPLSAMQHDRTTRRSPSIIWKAPASASPGAGGQSGPNSPVQKSPLSHAAQTPQFLPRQPQPQLQSQIQYQPRPASPAGPRASPVAAPTTPQRVAESLSPLSRSSPAMSRESVSSSPISAVSSPGVLAPPALPQLAAQLHRRREVTPPPVHHRVLLACDTGASTHPDDAHVGLDLDEDDTTTSVGTGVGEVGEPGSVPESLSIEQLIDRAPHAQAPPTSITPTLTPTTPSRSSRPSGTPGSTPTTPTFGPGPSANSSQHYRGRPLPQLPAEREGEQPVKRVPDGFPVIRVPDASGSEEPPPPPPRTPSPSRPVPSSSDEQTPRSTMTAEPAPVTAAPVAGHPSLPLPAPLRMERTESGGSVLEDARAAAEGPRAEFLQVTDLDILAARLVEGEQDGRNYEDLLLVQEIMGPATVPPHPTATHEAARAAGAAPEKAPVPYIGAVEVQRRRVLKDGRVKLKLSLLGVAVDRCGICLSQFRRAERGALTPVCRHSFHEACLSRWLRTAGVCPICRMALSMDD